MSERGFQKGGGGENPVRAFRRISPDVDETVVGRGLEKVEEISFH